MDITLVSAVFVTSTRWLPDSKKLLLLGGGGFFHMYAELG